MKSEPLTRTCSECLHTYPLNKDFFHKYDGVFRLVCKSCRNGSRRKIRSEQIGTDYLRYTEYLKNVWAKYRLREEDVRKLMDKQKGCCAICEQSLIYPIHHQTHMNIDHDHTTKGVRGLLCGRCNTVIGRMEEDIDILHQMILYIQEVRE